MNTETKHTPGRLKAQKTRGPQHAIDRNWELVEPLDSGEYVIVGEHTGIDSLTEANAVRLAACWNACLDMADPEKVIESLKRELCNSRTDRGLQYQELAQLKADKAALLTDIGTVVELLAEAKPIDYKRDCFNALVILRALIVKHSK